MCLIEDLLEDRTVSANRARIIAGGLPMFPILTTGDTVSISKGNDLNIGDIIVYRKMVCKRLVRILEKNGITYYQTKGDSELYLDEPITAEAIVGKVVDISRKHISFFRRVLLIMHPLLRYGRLNAFVILALLNIRNKPIRLMRNIILDLRFGGKFLGGTIQSRFSHLGAFATENTDYSVMSDMFKHIEVKERDVLVDIGCGKGRTINWWLHQSFKNKIIGIELDPDIAKFTSNRLRKYKNVTIISDNAIENIPEDGTIFYLYNPFDSPVVAIFKKRIEDVFLHKKDITVLYNNHVFIDVFKQDQRWSIRKITDFASILILKSHLGS